MICGWDAIRNKDSGHADIEGGSIFAKTSAENLKHLIPETFSYDDLDAFITEQKELRESNMAAAGGQKVLMCSHCWSNPDTQRNKRRLIASLGLNGWSYWADFLDLSGTSGDGIVYDMFPKHVADALMRGERAPEDRRECATILFCDIAGFTDLSTKLESTKVSDMLDRLFQQFDALATVHGIHKIETIGDCYIGASNLVEAQPDDHVARMARFSLDILEAAKNTPIDVSDLSLGNVRVRVGFDAGPVVGNVVGTRQLKYTVFGNTVNTASRMESSGVPGRVQCTKQAADLIMAQDSSIKLQERGPIEIKGKGIMHTFFVVPDELDEALGSPASSAEGVGGVVFALDANASPSGTFRLAQCSGTLRATPSSMTDASHSRRAPMGRLNSLSQGNHSLVHAVTESRSLKEVGQSIRDCAKVVSFVDSAYLQSFNSMQEVAFVFAYDKAIVPVILEQETVTLLSTAAGVEQAWQALQSMEGSALTPGVGDGTPLTRDWLASTFDTLHRLNLCMCRPEDFQTDGETIVMHRMRGHISAGLDYQREHQMLQSRALEWESSGRSHALLLKKQAVPEKKVWIAKALRDQRHPLPTSLQVQFIQTSGDKARRARRWTQLAMTVVFLVVAGLAGLATYKWIQNLNSLAEVERQVEVARNQTRVAEAQTRIANTQTIIAQTRLYLYTAKSDPHRNGYAQAAVREALAVVDQMPRSVREEIWEARTEIVRDGERRTIGYPVARFGNPTPTACCWSGAGAPSPDMKWIAFASTQATGLVNLYAVDTGAALNTSIPGANIYSVFWPAAADNEHFLVLETSPSARVLRVHVPATAGAGMVWEEVGTYNRNSSEPVENVLVAWDPAGEQVAVFFETGRLAVFDVLRGAEELLVEQLGAPVGGLDWSRDGTLLAHAMGSVVSVWDRARGGNSTLQHAEAELVIAVAFSPDSSQLVTAAQSGLLLVWDLAASAGGSGEGEGGPRSQVLDSEGEIKSPRLMGWSPDGRRLAVASNLQCRVYDMARRALDAVLETEGYVETLQWGEDSHSLVFFGIQGQVGLSRLEEPRPRGVVVPSATLGVISDLNLSPDATLLLSTTVDAVHVTELATAQSRVLLAGQGFTSADWSPDAGRVAVVDAEGVVRIVTVADGAVSTLGGFTDLDLDFGDGGFPINRFEVVWSPDGTMIAVSYTWGKHVAVWDLATGALRNIPTGISLEYNVIPVCIGVRWSRDSKFLALAPMWDDFLAHVSQTLVTVITVADGSLLQLVGTTSLIWAPPEFSPDGSKIAFGGIEHVSLWERGDGDTWEYRQLGADGTVCDVEWSADGTRLYSVSQKGMLREWDVATDCEGSRLLDQGLDAGKRGPRFGIAMRAGEAVMVTTDGPRVRLLSATSTHEEVVMRQSAGVSLQLMRAHFGLREPESADSWDDGACSA